MKARNASRGVSLAEALVSATLLLFIVSSAYAVLINGMSYLRTTNAAIDAQKSALSALSKISQSINSSKRGLLSTTQDGIVVASPFNSTGEISMDPTSGSLVWKTYVCYYRSERTLLTVSEPVSSPSSQIDSPDLAGKTVDYFSQLASTEKHIVASDVSAFNVSLTSSGNLGVQRVSVSITIGSMEAFSACGIYATTTACTRN